MRKDCYFCKNNIKEIDFKDTNMLSRYLDPLKKIKSPRYTGNCATHQRKISNSIKRARTMGLI
ncbi:MAG TPA: 30S ribosomal protein S18 [Candidatus Portnoybacteria bacterium]|nr:30S ribosomal protein S18 [Candidatus Portnoybacteria bacterium]MDD5752278.1 30S ribosomal protein S18 [Candidatus Portnoybacteria bacterium]HNU96880.1 30S ribosomal protein S18 [Candidatus Portnoybacteria bacterium]HOZ16344.1 30S ribosomal protein S18 [Candidatus Portnoybacteria bacterium]HPH52225.1 30S ribosomal protein S18 [Candidatus Portnoybacteria bacterium]